VGDVASVARSDLAVRCRCAGLEHARPPIEGVVSVGVHIIAPTTSLPAINGSDNQQ
jgi:hypothetical protein